MPGGFFGSRADLLVDGVLVLNLLAPFVALGATRLARAKRFGTHMRVQIGLWALMLACLLVLEGYIRISGGSGSIVEHSPYTGTWVYRTVFLAHILPAIATYLLWAGLVFTSFRRRAGFGAFAPRHRLLGKVVVAGLFWIAATAIGVYWLSFVA